MDARYGAIQFSREQGQEAGTMRPGVDMHIHATPDYTANVSVDETMMMLYQRYGKARLGTVSEDEQTNGAAACAW